jgi:hypothetical protein
MVRLSAESARPCCALLLAAAVTAGTAIAFVATSAPASNASEPRPHVHKMRGCGTAARAALATPPVQAEDPYVATLRSARPALDACMQGHDDLQVRLAVDIDGTGQVANVEVKTIAKDVAAIDMKVVKCVQTAVSPLVFPATGAPTRISTFLRP